jgi:hypothetical protein
LPNASVSEIHAYPLRPQGFEESLFPTPCSKQVLGEHLLRAPWLKRASELRAHTGQAAHAPEEPVELRIRQGRAEVVWPRTGRRCTWRRRWVVEVLDRWREVGGWWAEERGTNRFIFRVLLSGDVVADLARERSGDWILVGMVD